ncbi:hypothetical protein V6N13_108165 [Hibiscus sabdariffa]
MDWWSNVYYVGLLPSDDLQVDEIQQVDVHGFGGFLLLIMKAHFGASSAKWNFLGVQKSNKLHMLFDAVSFLRPSSLSELFNMQAVGTATASILVFFFLLSSSLNYSI